MTINPQSEKVPGIRVAGDFYFFCSLCFSRGGQIRTADLSDPNRARYQTALRPETEAADNGPAGGALSRTTTRVSAIFVQQNDWGQVSAWPRSETRARRLFPREFARLRVSLWAPR